MTNNLSFHDFQTSLGYEVHSVNGDKAMRWSDAAGDRITAAADDNALLLQQQFPSTTTATTMVMMSSSSVVRVRLLNDVVALVISRQATD